MKEIFALIIIVCCITVACSEPEPESAVIILTYEEKRGGAPDHATVVEYPDGIREIKYGILGEPGDTLLTIRGYKLK